MTDPEQIKEPGGNTMVEGGALREVSICLPAYNEARAISGVLEKLRENFPEAEIIVVDDGSADGTGEKARAVAGVRVLAHDRNSGYGASLKTAMRSATRKVIAWYDADGQHRPEDLAAVVTPVLKDEKDTVIGVRGADSHRQTARLPGKMLLKRVAELVARAPVPDLNSGLRAFRRDVILRYLHLLPDGFSASSTSTLLMMKRRYRIGYCPIKVRERIGQSTVKMLRDGGRTIKLLLRILMLFDAFLFFSLMSGVQLLAGAAYSAWAIHRSGIGLPVLGAVVLISGILTFFMGLLCDQVAALRLERLE